MKKSTVHPVRKLINQYFTDEALRREIFQTELNGGNSERLTELIGFSHPESAAKALAKIHALALKTNLAALNQAKRNPRYLVSLDGYDLATVPAFTKLDAVKRAKEIYPGKRGKWNAVQVEAEMFGRMRGGAETEARMRLERKRAAAAARTTTGRRRNGTHIHAETVGHLDVAKVHNPFIDYDDKGRYTFILIPQIDGEDEIYPVETADDIDDAQAAMAAKGINYAPVYLNDHGETVKTSMTLWVD